MACCRGHTCDYCATCKLGVCCGDSGRGPGRREATPIGEPRHRPSETPITAPNRPGSVPVDLTTRARALAAALAAIQAGRLPDRLDLTLLSMQRDATAHPDR